MAKTTIDDKRPLSPHLSIYRPQMSSMMSIMHRMTGVALSIGLLALAWGIIFAIYGYNYLPLFATPVGYIFLAGWSFSLFYHLLNGIRHLYWDMGKGLELHAFHRSGWAVVIGTTILTVGSWIIALS